jgi:dienelactone hydrolase
MMLRKTNRSIYRTLCGLLLVVASAVSAESIRQDVAIDSLLGDSIPALLSVPAGATPEALFPACLVLHGSGGLFAENAPGETCGPQLENNFEVLIGTLEQLGIVVLAPDSFGRNPLFCEDNDDSFFAFVPPPFHNAGDGALVRDDAYKARRIETRVLDAGAALKFLQDMPNVDDSRICVVGTSNGASVALVLSANATGRHAAQFADITQQRPLESANDLLDRQVAFENYPSVPLATEAAFGSLPVVRFTQAISPGCYFRKMIPTVNPASVNVLDWPEDFFHPEMGRDGYPGTFLYVDIGGDDATPDHCRSDGIRHIQATAYQDAFNVVPPRWLPVEYPGYGHDLVRDNPEIVRKTRDLAIDHFYRIFRDGWD